MAIDTTTPRSRRALLTAAVGGVAAAVAATVARAAPVEAAHEGSLKLEHGNQVSAGTSLTATSAPAVGYALRIDANSGSPRGLWVNTNKGKAVSGDTSSGTALEGSAGSGLALHTTKGRIRFGQISGVATIKKGSKSVTVSPGVDINAKTFVLLTPMSPIGSRGLWFTKLGAANKIVIHMSSKRTGPTKVAWLALERG